MSGPTRIVRMALEKAHDSALLAVEVYNKPAVKFKSGGYITLMVIAWTSLFHAIFFRRKIKPYYKNKNRHFVRLDGDFKYWELDECLHQYFGADTDNAVRKNLEFFIPLRNQIEHRSMPEIDGTIFGECQAMLLNFDEFIEKEFGSKHCLRECLSFSLQLFPNADSLVESVKRNPSAKPLVNFIQQYRSTISPEVTASGKYSFKAFLIQVANHKSDQVLPIQFVHYDKLNEDEKKSFGPLVAMVKYRDIPVSNSDLIKPGEVVKRVQVGLGHPTVARGGKQVERFTLDTHARCWRHFKARPTKGSPDPRATDQRYCAYDKMHNDYGYTQAWIDLLIAKLKVETEWSALYREQSK